MPAVRTRYRPLNAVEARQTPPALQRALNVLRVFVPSTSYFDQIPPSSVVISARSRGQLTSGGARVVLAYNKQDNQTILICLGPARAVSQTKTVIAKGENASKFLGMVQFSCPLSGHEIVTR